MSVKELLYKRAKLSQWLITILGITMHWPFECYSYSRQANTSARCESRTGTAIRLSSRWRCILVILALAARQHERSQRLREPSGSQQGSNIPRCRRLLSFGPMRRMRVMQTTAARLSLGCLFDGDQWESWHWFFIAEDLHYSLLRRRKLCQILNFTF